MKAGDRYGSWLVLDPYPERGVPYALCRCDCGFERTVARPNLISGASSRCQKCQGRMTAERALRNLAGEQFGCWFVLEDPDWMTGAGRRRVVAQCGQCHESRVLAASSLPACVGQKRCGRCFRREVSANAVASAKAVAATGISRQGIHQRIKLRHWSLEDAQTQPALRPHGRRKRTRPEAA